MSNILKPTRSITFVVDNNDIFKIPQIPLASEGSSRTQTFWKVIAVTILKSTGLQKRNQKQQFRDDLKRKEEYLSQQKEFFQKSHENIGEEYEAELIHTNSSLMFKEKSTKTLPINNPSSQLLHIENQGALHITPSQKMQKTFRNIYRIKKIFKKDVDSLPLEYRGLSEGERAWLTFIACVQNQKKQSIYFF
jgi:hypothetical protein